MAADSLLLVRSYLSLRSSPAHALLRSLPRYAINQLLQATRKYDLPLAEKLVYQDLKELSEQSRAKPKATLASSAGGISSERPQKKKHGRGMMEGLVADEDWEDILSLSQSTRTVPLLAKLVESASIDTLPPNIIQQYPNMTYVDRLERVWSSFLVSTESVPSTFDSSKVDLRTSFLFLLQLLSAADSINLLPLALDVFKSLTERSISDSVIASAPTAIGLNGTALSREIMIKLVILRTIVGAGLEEEMYDIVGKALKGISSLRGLYTVPEGIGNVDDDYDLLRSSIESLLDASTLIRLSNYKVAPSSFSDPIIVVHSLLRDDLPIFDPSSTASTLHSPTVHSLLRQFSQEILYRDRLDLLASMRVQYGEGAGWMSTRSRLKLMRYYGGTAHFRDYYELDPEGSLIRSVNAAAFDELVVATFYAVSDGTLSVRKMQRSEQSMMIEVICTSRARSGRSVDLAKRLYNFFRQSSSTVPFILSPTALLSLVDAVSPPVGNDVAFAQTAIANHIAVLTSTDSAFASASSIISHHDLTTLATCYSIVNDFNSVAQVFRKMFDQKMVPDAKDLQVFLMNAARRHPRIVLLYLKMASGVGMVMTEVLFTQVVKQSMAFHRSQGTAWQGDLLRLVNLAEELGLATDELSRLEKVGRDQMLGTAVLVDAADANAGVEGIRRGRFMEIRPAVLSRMIKNTMRVKSVGPAAEEPWRTALSLYETAVDSRIVTDKILETTLTALLRHFDLPRQREGTKDSVQAALVEVLESALTAGDQSIAPIIRSKTYGLILRAIIKLNDVDALWILIGLCDKSKVEPSDEMAEKMRRWAIERIGREAVDARGGWIARPTAKVFSERSRRQAESTL